MYGVASTQASLVLQISFRTWLHSGGEVDLSIRLFMRSKICHSCSPLCKWPLVLEADWINWATPSISRASLAITLQTMPSCAALKNCGSWLLALAIESLPSSTSAHSVPMCATSWAKHRKAAFVCEFANDAYRIWVAWTGGRRPRELVTKASLNPSTMA